MVTWPASSRATRSRHFSAAISDTRTRQRTAPQRRVVALVVLERQDADDVAFGEDPLGEGVFTLRQFHRGADVER
jgi:hypothetical protein